MKRTHEITSLFFRILFVLKVISPIEISAEERDAANADLESILRSNSNARSKTHYIPHNSQKNDLPLLYSLPDKDAIAETQKETASQPLQKVLNETLIAADPPLNPQAEKTVLINFNNVSMIEYIRFISRITNRNFIFDESDLQFNVTIVSEEPATIDNIMTALLQELRIRDLSLIEE